MSAHLAAVARAAGGAVTLSATVTGPSSPFTYQWTAQTAGGGQSPDATKLSTTFTNVTGDVGANAALYVLAATNACGTTSSAPATVTLSAASGTTTTSTSATGTTTTSTTVDQLQAIDPATFSSGEGLPPTRCVLMSVCIQVLRDSSMSLHYSHICATTACCSMLRANIHSSMLLLPLPLLP